ncbi:isoprenylcysteine carboxylmethyltransferase family protein [Herbaspirillum sp. HC18]|nr:isoprenylcysteine carboxylmethyltransferase family protein [Herbaspirillum sp. HC18]
MKILELRVPPVALVVVFATIMWLLTRLVPAATVVRLNWWAAVIPALAGGIVALAGVAAFRGAHTTVNPTTPEASSSVVTTGVYRWSRNPMYLGFLLFLVGWVLYLGNLGAALFLPLFVLYMNRYQIAPEERMLNQKFGSEYVNYTRRVRRWL